MPEPIVGLSAELQQTVTADMLAVNVGSGSVAVFATPELVLLLEKAAVAALEDHLDQGMTTVGSGLDVLHLAATPEGMQVTATARVTSVEGRKVSFEVSARDEKEEIASGTHTRFIITAKSFQSRANAKLTQDSTD